MANPELASGFSNPKVQAAIIDISQNPMNIMKYQTDPEVMKVRKSRTPAAGVADESRAVRARASAAGMDAEVHRHAMSYVALPAAPCVLFSHLCCILISLNPSLASVA